MISFRPVESGDKEKIRRWRNQPHIRRYMLTQHEISEEEHAAWFEKISNSPQYQHWIICCDGQDVGLVNIYDIDVANRSCYWGFYVAEGDVRGKNVGMFAEYFVLQFVFQELKLEKLCCETLDFNRGVLRLHQAFGFVEDGRGRRQLIRDGQAHDVVSMCIGFSEWEKKRPEFEAIFRARKLL